MVKKSCKTNPNPNPTPNPNPNTNPTPNPNANPNPDPKGIGIRKCQVKLRLSEIRSSNHLKPGNLSENSQSWNRFGR